MTEPAAPDPGPPGPPPRPPERHRPPRSRFPWEGLALAMLFGGRILASLIRAIGLRPVAFAALGAVPVAAGVVAYRRHRDRRIADQIRAARRAREAERKKPAP